MLDFIPVSFCTAYIFVTVRVRVVFEAEASGGSKAGGLSILPFPFPSPPPFHSPYILSLPVGGKVRSSEGEVPRLPPPTNTTLVRVRVQGYG